MKTIPRDKNQKQKKAKMKSCVHIFPSLSRGRLFGNKYFWFFFIHSSLTECEFITSQNVINALRFKSH